MSEDNTANTKIEETKKPVKATPKKAKKEANPQDDYALFQSQVENILRMEAMNEWVSKNISSTYIRIDPTFDDCDFQMNWYEYIWSSQKEK